MAVRETSRRRDIYSDGCRNEFDCPVGNQTRVLAVLGHSRCAAALKAIHCGVLIISCLYYLQISA